MLIMSKLVILSCIAIAAFTMSSCSCDQEKCNVSVKEQMEQAEAARQDSLKAIVSNFYKALSTTPNDATAGQTATWMAENWNSNPTPQGGKDLTGFVKTLFMFHGMIPDLKWTVKDMLISGNKVIVRSLASGTPNSPEGYFFGVPTNGNKSFEVQTIDIHTLKDGKLVEAYHVEDWATAIQQVSAQ